MAVVRVELLTRWNLPLLTEWITTFALPINECIIKDEHAEMTLTCKERGMYHNAYVLPDFGLRNVESIELLLNNNKKKNWGLVSNTFQRLRDERADYYYIIWYWKMETQQLRNRRKEVELVKSTIIGQGWHMIVIGHVRVYGQKLVDIRTLGVILLHVMWLPSENE